MEKFIQDLAVQAGRRVLKHFGVMKAHHQKSESRTDALTHADLEADRFITGRIKKTYPTHGIISEESGRTSEDAEYVWIIDPIDGTMNFASGVPLFAVMIALAHKGKIILSAVYMPVTKELLFAKKGKGAYLNGKRMRCSKVTKLGETAGCIPTKGAKSAKFLKNLLDEVEGTNALFNAFGCIAANCRYIAAGERDWVVTVSGGLHDYAPTSLILSEAGCRVSGIDCKPWSMKSKGIIAANPALYPALVSLVKKSKIA